MLCTVCGKNPATTHVKRTINGISKEYHICRQCAENLGFADEFSELSSFSDFEPFSATNIFASLLGMTPSLNSSNSNAKRCSGCGATFEEIKRTGKVGCAKCYDEFGERLNLSIEKIHGVSNHCGKKPSEDPNEALQKEISELNEKMKVCIEKQEFEEAAKIRDRIKEIKEGIDNE